MDQPRALTLESRTSAGSAVRAWWLVAGLLLLAAAATPWLGSRYHVSFVFFLLMHLVMTATYDLVGGYMGYINLGHGAFTYKLLEELQRRRLRARDVVHQVPHGDLAVEGAPRDRRTLEREHLRVSVTWAGPRPPRRNGGKTRGRSRNRKP